MCALDFYIGHHWLIASQKQPISGARAPSPPVAPPRAADDADRSNRSASVSIPRKSQVRCRDTASSHKSRDCTRSAVVIMQRMFQDRSRQSASWCTCGEASFLTCLRLLGDSFAHVVFAGNVLGDRCGRDRCLSRMNMSLSTHMEELTSRRYFQRMEKDTLLQTLQLWKHCSVARRLRMQSEWLVYCVASV